MPSEHYLDFRVYKNEDNDWEMELIDKDEKRYVFYHIDAGNIDHQRNGILKRIEDKFGNTIEFFHYPETARIDYILDTYGRRIDFFYDNMTSYRDPNKHMLTRIVDFAGREIKYEYHNQVVNGVSVNKLLHKVYSPEVTTENGNDFTDANGLRKCVEYEYNITTSSVTSPIDRFIVNQLVSIKDGNGNLWLENTYSSETDPKALNYNRVIRQRYGDGAFNFYYENVFLTADGQPADAETPEEQVVSLICTVNDRRGVVRQHLMNKSGNTISTRTYTGLAPDADAQTTFGLDMNSPATPKNLPVNPIRSGDFDVPKTPTYFASVNTFDKDGKPLVTDFQRGNKMSRVYNDSATKRRGQNNVSTTVLTSVDGMETLTTSTTYEERFQLIKTSTDAMGNVTTFFYDYEEGPSYLNKDLNDDSVTNGELGVLVRVEYAVVKKGMAVTNNGGSHQKIVSMFQYNSYGQMTKSIDGESNVVEYKYYPNNDPDGDGQIVANYTSYDTNAGGYLSKVIRDPDGLALETSYTYDIVGNVTSITDSNNHVTSFEVNQLNQVVKVSSPKMELFPEDNLAVYEQVIFYDANDNVETIWQEVENSNLLNGTSAASELVSALHSSATHLETTFSYDQLDNVISKQVEVKDNQPSAAYTSLTTRYKYDKSENLIEINYPNGQDVDRIEYDERDLIYTTTIGYQDVNAVPESVTKRYYDVNGNLQLTVHPNNNHKTHYEWDGFDRLEIVRDEASKTYVKSYFDNNSNTILTEIYGHKDAASAAAQNAQVALLNKVATKFDALNRPYESNFSIIDHQSELITAVATTQVEYNKNSLVVTVENPNGNQHLSSYDKASRMDGSMDANGNRLEYVLDNNSNVLMSKSYENKISGGQELFTQIFRHDELNRVREIKDDLKNLTQIRLDSRGFVQTITDAENNKKEYFTDGLGRTVEEKRDAWQQGQITLNWRFDKRGRMTHFTDGRSMVTKREFDSHNRMIRRDNAFGTSEQTTKTYEYDLEGNLDIVVRENGSTIDYDFDDTNRLMQRHFKDSTGATQIIDHFEYNGMNFLTKIYEENGSEMKYERDSRGLVLKSKEKIKNTANDTYFATKTFTMTYNLIGQPTSVSYPSTRIVNYNDFDNIELLGNITTNGFISTPLVQYGFDGTGRIANKTLANGMGLTVSYDSIKRVAAYLHKNISTSKVHVGFIEDYDKVHNRISEVYVDDNLVSP